jgi:hypothetical protein
VHAGGWVAEAKAEELFIRTKMYFKSLFPLRTIPTGDLINPIIWSACTGRERKYQSLLSTTAIHRYSSVKQGR